MVNPVFHEWKKHVEIDYHFIHDELQEGHIIMLHVIQNTIGKHFTKALGHQQFHFLLGKLGA